MAMEYLETLLPTDGSPVPADEDGRDARIEKYLLYTVISKEALVAAAKYAISESEAGEGIANEDVESAIASSISKGWNEVHTAIEGKRKLGTADELLSELESSESL